MKKRNGTIDYFKFVFSIIIVGLHAGSFYNTETSSIWRSGFIAVEFFFIVSGYLLTASAAKVKTENVFNADLHMLTNKVIHIFPYILIASVFSNIFYAVSGRLSARSIGTNMLLSVSDMFGLQMAGFKGFWATGVAWYISALYIVSFIIYPVLCRKRELYTKYLAPIISLLLLGYMCKVSGTLDVPGDWWRFIFKGLLRGFADISVGSMAYELKLTMDKNDIGKLPMLVVELGGFLVTLLYAMFHGRGDYHDFFMVPLLMGSVAAAFSENSVLSSLFSKKIFNTLGAFSLSIYLNHFYVKQTLPLLLPAVGRKMLLLEYFALVFVLAWLNYTLGKRLSSVLRSMRRVITAALVWMSISCLVLFCSCLDVNIPIRSLQGSGTQEDPFIISSKRDLETFQRLVNGGKSFTGQYVLQIADIDLENEEWTPIGIFGSNRYFDGIYNGGNHHIDNLLITKSSATTANVGLFGTLTGTVENLGIKSGRIIGHCVGAITSHGSGDHALIINCFNMASIEGDSRAGGICDNMSTGTVLNCVNAGTLIAPQMHAIVSYDAKEVNAIPESDNSFPISFSGTLGSVVLQGETVTEMLNNGVDELVRLGIVNPEEITKWP